MLSPELLTGMAVTKGLSRARKSQRFPSRFPCTSRGVIHWENAEGNGGVGDHSLLTNAAFCQGNFTESREIQFIPG